MTKPRFNKILSLNEEQYKRLEALVSKKIKIMDVFVAGLEAKEKESK